LLRRNRGSAIEPADLVQWPTFQVIETTVAYLELFRGEGVDETILLLTKPFFAWLAELRKRRMVINPSTTTGGERRSRPRRQSDAHRQFHPCYCVRDLRVLDGRFD
jgi:hypothetical protein